MEDRYLLSELYGKIGQILREHGDMPVVRRQSMHIDGFISNTTPDINLKSKNFMVHNINGHKFYVDV